VFQIEVGDLRISKPDMQARTASIQKIKLRQYRKVNHSNDFFIEL